SALDLDELTRSRPYDVHINFGSGVLCVVKVEQRAAADDPNRNCGNVVRDRYRAGHFSLVVKLSQGQYQGNKSTRDRCGARSAVRLDHITIDIDGPLAYSAAVDHGPQGSTDQSLDLLRSAGKLIAPSLTLCACLGRPRKHRILGGDPAFTLATQEHWHPLVD